MIRIWATRILLICTLVAVTGGQWMLLQSAAWAGMIVSNLRHDSLQVAVSQTFDGQHPCPLCKAIESGKKSEKKSDVEVKITQIEFPPTDCLCGLTPNQDLRFAIALHDEYCESISRSPLHRPPRLILA